ncbi:MAG: SOS response-associated peptidase family protein [Enhydrobacter sp.]|nr:MAG: SOS response-associated peptidase family protein [Enhydrobacter sp.]
MCNLYTMKLSRDEVRGLLRHYKLLGRDWAEVISGQNTPTDIYPRHAAPVATRESGRLAIGTMRWGMPGPTFPPKPGEKPKRQGFITNIRNSESRHWLPWLQAAEVTVGKDRNRGGRCLVPAAAFAEPDRTTRQPVVNRWFARADGRPFFFAGVWREWTGDVGTIKAPNVGRHRLFAFLTTVPNGVVTPIHDKAMPVMLMTAEDVACWLNGTLEEALKLQKPQPDDAIVVVERKRET